MVKTCFLVAGLVPALLFLGPRALAAPPDGGAPAGPAASSAPPAAPRATATEPTKRPPKLEPRFHHAPLSVASAHEALDVFGTMDRMDRVKRLLLVYRGADGKIADAPFLRSGKGFESSVPAEAVAAPSVAYAVEAETPDGTRVPLFASRDAMHVVEVKDDLADLREKATLARLDGRRSRFTASGEYVFFGEEDGTVIDPGTGATTTRSVRDEYWRTDASYTYRSLGIVSEFGIAFGVVRGSAVPPTSSDTSASRFDVGLNYGAPRIRFRLTDWMQAEAETLTSVTEVGFSIGGGGALLFGDAYGTHLTLGVEGIQVFGVRGWSTLDVRAGSRVTISPTVEVTNMPHASDAGVRGTIDVRVDLGHGFGLSARAGYQARTFAQGGPGGGLGLSYSF